MDFRSLLKRSPAITSVYRRMQYRRSAQQPWDGVPEGYRDLPVGRFRLCGSLNEWQEYREHVRSTVLQCLGDVPPRSSPQVRIISTEQRDGYRLEKIGFHNGVDSNVPGYIAVPDAPGPRRLF